MLMTMYTVFQKRETPNSYTYIHIHTNLYSAKNRENESEALAQDD